MESRLTLIFAFLFSVSVFAQPCGYSISETITPISCNDACNGAITINVSGGTPPYNYSWNNSGSSNSIANLCQGIYKVTITGATGCDSVFSASELINPEPIKINLLKYDINCGILGTVTASPLGGNPPYKYLFTGFSDSLDSPDFEDLEQGTYNLTVGDSKGCSADTTFEILDLDCNEPVAIEAFSPNGDGINDSWQIINLEFFPNYRLYIYDRWGQKVFDSNSNEMPWKGEGVSGTLPAATYYYVIQLDQTNKNSKVVNGCVSIAR